MANYDLEESLMLLMLNDDCIYRILKELPLDAMFSFSMCCKRIRSLCANYFERNFRKTVNKTVQVRSSSNGSIRYNEAYVTYFNHLIKKLRICGEFDTTSKQNSLASFVKAKCNPSLNEITINGAMELNQFCMETSNLLQNVEIVHLIYGIGRNWPTFLDYCPNLTTLSLSLVHNDEMTDVILGRRYPKLEHFHLQYYSTSRLKPDKLKTFLQKNSQIQCIEFLKFHRYHKFEEAYEIEEVKRIEMVVAFASNLKHFFLVIDAALAKHIEQICGCLEKLCDRSDFKSLELKFTENRLINHFEKLKKIHIHSVPWGIEDLNLLRRFTHLKSIAIEKLPVERNLRWLLAIEELDSKIDRIPFRAPSQIEEVTILDDRVRLVSSFMLLFARHWKSLKKMSVLNVNLAAYTATFPVAALNRAREKLENAQQLTIFTDYGGNRTDLSDKLVKLQCMERSDHSSVDATKKYCMSSATHYRNVPIC